jgi:ATP-dependent Lon protease
MDNTDVKAVVNSEIKKFVNDSLDKEIKKLLRSSNSASRDELISTIKNAIESVYKVLWQKREFWKNDIK